MSLLFQWKCFVVFRYKQNYERMYQLKEWQNCGGVMVMGYEMFRNLTNPKAARIRKRAIETFQSTLIDPGEIVFLCDCCVFWVNVTHSLGIHVTLNGPCVHVCVCLYMHAWQLKQTSTRLSLVKKELCMCTVQQSYSSSDTGMRPHVYLPSLHISCILSYTSQRLSWNTKTDKVK